jgi:hypothetical protein
MSEGEEIERAAAYGDLTELAATPTSSVLNRSRRIRTMRDSRSAANDGSLADLERSE